MIQHPLHGVIERLNRADENIVNLEREIADFRQQNPHVKGTHYDPHTGKLTHDVTHKKAPLRFSVLAGEILFLLRSSLDHVVAQLLIQVHHSNPDLDKILTRSEFPIYTDPSKWKSFDWTKIPSVSPQVSAAITDSQPCNRVDGLPPEDHPLAVLSSMNNVDKHRLLLVLANAVKVAGFTFSPSGNVYIKHMHFGGSASSTGVNTELVQGHIELGPGGGVEVDSQVSIEIAFKQVGTRMGEPVIPTLQHLSQAVRKLVDGFKAAFF